MRDLVFKVEKGQKARTSGAVYLIGKELVQVNEGGVYTAVNDKGEVLGQCKIDKSEKDLIFKQVTLTATVLVGDFTGIAGLLSWGDDTAEEWEKKEHTESSVAIYSALSTSSVGGEIETVATLAFIATVLMGFLSGMMTGIFGIGLIVGLVSMIPGYISFILVKGYGEIVSNSAKAVNELKEIKELMKK